MNYRIDLRREAVINAIHTGNLSHLYVQDQLHKEMTTNRGFRLRPFTEGPLNFPPTYKYDRRSNVFDSSEKARAPAWCDRILYRCRQPSRVQNLHYRRYEANVSDHRPISGGYTITVKSVNRDLMMKAQMDLQDAWDRELIKLLTVSHKFYVEQEVL